MEECSKLFLSGNFNLACIQLLLSKALSYAIIFFSFILKVPQIKNMMKIKTDKGLSYLSIYTEILIFLLGFLYGFHNKIPFSAYGENLFILIQVLIILFLSWKYSEEKYYLLGRLLFITSLIVFPTVCLFCDSCVPETIWKLIGSSGIPLATVARMSQIILSFKTKDTGALSAFTFLLSLAGSMARIFTSLTETNDFILILSYSYGAFLNLIILIQIFIYGSKSKVGEKGIKTE